jgi:hypothetical protein
LGVEDLRAAAATTGPAPVDGLAGAVAAWHALLAPAAGPAPIEAAVEA